MDEETIIREADKIGRRAWNQLLERYPGALPYTGSPATLGSDLSGDVSAVIAWSKASSLNL